MKRKILILVFLVFNSILVNAQIVSKLTNVVDKVLIGCFSSSNLSEQPTMRYTQSQLKLVAQAVFLDGRVAQSASLKYQSNIDMWYIQATFLKQNVVLHSAIQVTKEGNALYLTVDDCCYECNPTNGCTTCNPRVQEKCKSLFCDCTDGGYGGCSSVIGSISIIALTRVAAIEGGNSIVNGKLVVNKPCDN